MQMRSPPQPDARRIGLDDDRIAIAYDRDDSQQLGGLDTFPATHTGAHRSRATYHYESLPGRLDGRRAMVAPAPARRRTGSIGGIGTDVDPPTGQPGGQAGILPLSPDSQGKLIIRYRHPRRPGRRVHHLDAQRLGRRERVADERGRVLRPVDDVDLLAVQFAHHRADPLAHRPDAGALGVRSGLGGPYGDLRPVSGFAGDGGDLDGTVGDLRYLQREQLLDQARMGPGQGDLRSPEALGDVHHDALDPHAVLVDLAGYLLGRRQDGLQLAQVDRDDALLGPRLVRLYHAGDQVAVATGVLAEVHLVGGLAEALEDHLLGGHRGDPAEVVRGVVVLPDDRAVGVQLLGVDGGGPGAAVDLHACVRCGSFGVPVRGEQRRLDRGEDRLVRDLPLALQRAEGREVDVHSSSSSSSSGSSSTWPNSTCTRPGPRSAWRNSCRAPFTSRTMPWSSASINRPVSCRSPAVTAISRPTLRRQW